eukprot:GSA120T00003852001.1
MVQSYLNTRTKLLEEIGAANYYNFITGTYFPEKGNNSAVAGEMIPKSNFRLQLLSEDLERVNDVVEFAKEVEWKEWHSLFTRVMKKTNLILIADNEGNYWSEAKVLDSFIGADDRTNYADSADEAGKG